MKPVAVTLLRLRPEVGADAVPSTTNYVMIANEWETGRRVVLGEVEGLPADGAPGYPIDQWKLSVAEEFTKSRNEEIRFIDDLASWVTIILDLCVVEGKQQDG